jgi:anti-sigma regulatory factor (Ser/Thr protein kinase)
MGQRMAASVRDDEGFWSIVLPPTAASVPSARHFANEALHALGVGEHDERAERAQLLVSELATNAVVHARTPMRVSVGRHDGNLRVEVHDDDPSQVRRVTPDPLARGGRGIMLVESMATAWGVNRDAQGKTIWFELGEE